MSQNTPTLIPKLSRYRDTFEDLTGTEALAASDSLPESVSEKKNIK